jgi:hypothetical protein
MQYFPFISKAKNLRKNNNNNFSTVDKFCRNTVQSVLFLFSCLISTVVAQRCKLCFQILAEICIALGL